MVYISQHPVSVYFSIQPWLLEEHRPDLVILDIMMPEFDGLQVLSLIRQSSDIPVIMLTARTEVTILRDALVLGADDYVRKPFGTQELLARIQAKLRRAGIATGRTKSSSCYLPEHQ